MTAPGPTPERPYRAVRATQGLLAALVGVLLVLAGIVVGAVPGAAQNRVGASTAAGANTVGASAGIAAGQRLGKVPPQSRFVVASSVAAKGVDGGVDLFRHVSPGELADIGEHGFRPGLGSMEGKWFAESGKHATQWGQVLNGGEGSVVKVRVPTSFVNQLTRLEKLDGIGPARYVDPGQLGELNQFGWQSWP